MTPIRKAVALAGSQGGHITWAQLVACGLSPNQIGRRRQTDGWCRVLPRVYRLGGVSDSIESRLDAVNLWMGNDGYFCSSTAARLLRLDGIPRSGPITVARTSASPTPSWLQVRRLAPNDRPKVRLVGGRRLPLVERILLEVAADVPLADAGLALDDALRRRITSIRRLEAFIESSPHRKGIRVLRSLLRTRDLRDEEVRSKFETRMLAILRRLDTPVTADHEVFVVGERFFLDFFIPEVRLGIECHSIKWHLGEEAFKKDLRRHRLIASLGIEVLFFSWDEVSSNPERVEDEIRSAVERRRLRLFSK